MKRFVIAALLALLLVSSLFSFKFDRDDHLLIGTGNDRFTMGISNNYDDNLSFNSSLEYQNGNLHLMTYLNGYTDRDEGKRHDELLVLGSWNFSLLKTHGFLIDLMPSGGIDIDGNLGFWEFQNDLHKLMNIPTVDLEYPDKATVKPYGDILLSARYSITDELRVGLFLDGQYWDKFRLNASIALQYKHSSFMLGYDGQWNTNIRLDLGLFQINHRSNLESKVGFGSVSIDALSFFREKTWKNSDVYISVGKTYLQSFLFTVQQTVQTIPNWPVDITIYNRYFTGKPTSSKLGSNESVIRHHTQTAIGVSYTFPDLWIFMPFVELGGGIANWQMQIINSTDKQDYPKLTTAFAILRLGTDIIPEGAIVIDSTTLMIDTAVEFNYFFNADKITDYIKQDKLHDNDFAFKSFCITFTIGFTFGLDLY